jgi:Raf kinase inhibitor-like YbhB/YbcL family protein
MAFPRTAMCGGRVLEKLPESVGHALINQRAGMDSVLYNELFRQRSAARLDLSSQAFVFNGRLPVRFTADGDGLSPPLSWDGVPREAESLALIVEDADSPTPHPLVHAIVVGLLAGRGSLDEGALNSPDHVGAGVETGQNSFFRRAWLPPDPPRGHGEHRYVFQVYALRAGATFSEAPGRREFIATILDRAIAVGCLIGTYERSERAHSGLEVAEAETGDFLAPSEVSPA